MKVSLNLVKKFVSLENLTPTEIANKLTFAGVEVESIETLASGTNLVVGEVLTCENMPDSDHLHLTTVNTGEKYGVLHIVCGAHNVRKGLKVIVARDGAKLPGGIIKTGKIRGYVSEGMLCSLSELGVASNLLSEEQLNGIEELKVGNVGDENVLELLGLDDTILDLKLLANRSDLYSIYNVAKEIKTLFDKQLSLPKIEDVSGNKVNFHVSSMSDKCKQFSALIVKNVLIKESPSFLKEALRSSNIRSINNIVDIGNYVMLLTGQPLHMYDLDKLPKHELIVKDDLEGNFVALDEKTYVLQKGDLCVTSNGEVMCLGGVMGSQRCAIDENTKNIVVEAANFDFASIRRTSIRLNLSSDSSQRFVKGINPNQYNDVLALTLFLLKNYASATENSQIITYLKDKYEPKIIHTTFDYINSRLGTNFSKKEIVSSLERAFIKVNENNNELICSIPDSRIDISGEADLSEEVIRILGFENVKSELPRMKLSVGALEEKLAKKRVVRNFLRGLGLDEQITYSLVKEKEINDFRLLNLDEAYQLINPLSDEHAFVRTNLLPSLMNALVFNLSHGNNNVNFFEVSDLYSQNNRHIHLGVVLHGHDNRRGALSNETYGYYHIKGIVDGLLDLFNIDNKRVQISRSNKSEFHKGKSADLKIDGKYVATFGELHPTILEKYSLKGDTAVLEMDLDALFSVKTSIKKMAEVSKFPPVNHDLAIVLKEDVLSEDVIKEIYKVNREIITNVEIFDVYKGEHIESGYYSLALSITYTSLDKTLTSEEVSSIENKILEVLDKKFNAQLRK